MSSPALAAPAAPSTIYLGLDVHKDSITKAGNAHCRHALIQAAWSYRYMPKVAAHLKARQAGQPPGVIAHAWKAQQRLHQRYTHLSYRKQQQIAVVAVVRKLVGFLWAAMQDLGSRARAATDMSTIQSEPSGVWSGTPTRAIPEGVMQDGRRTYLPFTCQTARRPRITSLDTSPVIATPKFSCGRT